MTRAQKLKLLNSLALATERRARHRHAGTDGCRLCLKNIEEGESYRDGGPGRRAHTPCVEQETRRAEH